MAFTQLEVTSLYAATFEDSTMDASTLEGWMNNSAANLSELAAAMFAEADRYLTTLTTTEFVSALYEDVLGREAEAEGLAYWVNQIDTEAVSKDVMVLALIEGASSADDIAYVAAAAEDANNSVTGNTEMLTTAQDDIDGSQYADTFNAYIFDNANTAQSGDMISAGGSTDTLYADIGSSQNFAITLHTDSVENFQVRAQADATDSNDNNMDANVQIDAERMDGTDRYESNNSRADVVIEDVRIEDSQITSDITIAMVQTDPGDVDFAVYFDQHSLRAAPEGESGASLILEIMDTRSADAGLDPLLENPFDGFTFTVDGNVITIASEAIDAATTYAELLTAVQTQVAANLDLVDFTVALSGTFTAIDTDSGNALTGQTLVITNNGAGVLGTGTWSTADGSIPAGGGLHRDQEVGDPNEEDNLITSDIILDHVGRGSMGGDLLIGALSIGDSSDSTGVEQFDILVDRTSELETINSTNNTLREVYIVNGDNELNDVDGTANGNLTVLGNVVTADQAPDAEDDMQGDQTEDGAFGFTDVRIIDASTMVGSVTLDAELTDDVVAKFMDRQDDAANAGADNSDDRGNLTDTGFVYTMGTNNDSFALTISNANLAAAGTTNREDFELAINGGAGNDTLTTIIGDGSGVAGTNWYENSKLNANLAIDAGAGDDTITTTGAGDFIINAGADNDTVYANNDGVSVAVSEVAAVAGDFEVQTLTFSAAIAGGGVVVDGNTIDIVAADTAIVVGGKVQAVLNALAQYAAVDNGDGTVTVTYAARGVQDLIVIDGAVTGVAGTANEDTAGVDVVLAVDEVAAGMATWAVNATDLNIDDLQSGGVTTGRDTLLSGAQLTVTYSGAQTAGTSGITGANDATLLDNGFESTVTIGTTDGVGNELSINQAIKDAINNDAVLSKLLVVNDGPGNTLVIESLVDGEFVVDDLQISIESMDFDDMTAAEVAEAKLQAEDIMSDSTLDLTDAELQDYLNDAVANYTTTVDGVGVAGVTLAGELTLLELAQDNTADMVGAASTTDSDNTITLGTGDDVVVLGTDGSSNDTVVFSGSFGNDTIFNFEEGAGAGADDLDFTAYLTSSEHVALSASEVSQTRIVTSMEATATVAAGQTIAANSVTVLTGFAAVGTETWAAMTGADLLAAIHDANNVAGADNYGNIDIDTLDVEDFGATLVGTTQKQIVLIHNEANDGEYKVFELTSTTDADGVDDEAADEFTAATLVGTIDVGDDISATLVVGDLA